MSRESYKKQLESIQGELLKMGSLVEKQIHEAVRSLSNQDFASAHSVLENDDIVDQMQIDIEERCMSLIALQQPVARDLRTIMAILKITTDLERIGDHACNIAELTLRIGEEPLIKPLSDIPYMARKTESMVRDSLTSFIQRDLELAEAVRRSDQPVDEMYSQLFDELIGFVLMDSTRHEGGQAINLLFVARYLERIADHATNIAERVMYMVTGHRVDHMRTGPGTPHGVDVDSLMRASGEDG
ncbi:MAG: phosphate signaling complex protein PhoU [Firmicutes bacterium]|nr:phosphate signaling complex protein PhoU [Bacillota bacterium]